MAASIPIGGIVVVPDPVTGGGGAPVAVAEIVNAMWTNAQAKSVAGMTYIAGAQALSNIIPQIPGVILDQSYLPPVAPFISPTNPADAEAMYNATRIQMQTLIETQFSSFIGTYFSNPRFYNDALAWCDTAITTGGSGINTFVEQQLWERGRARLLSDSQRLSDEATAMWANRRFPLPPGALANQVLQINLDASRKLAEASRDISVKSFETEVENIRFAVKEVLVQRKVALDAAGDYIRTLMLGPQTAMQLATGLAGLRNEFARTLVALYGAQVSALEPRVRLAITDAQLKMEAEKANMAAISTSVDQKVRAALEGAQLLASQASAGLNAIHAQAGISGSDQSQV
jgi:hypothetical protein